MTSKGLKVFISSATEGLEETRQGVATALETAGYQPIHHDDTRKYEHGAPRSVCERDVRSSDALVCIFAERWGSIPADDNPDRLSVTAMELRWAWDADVPVFIFVQDRPVHRDSELSSFIERIGRFSDGEWFTRFSRLVEVSERAVQAVRSFEANEWIPEADIEIDPDTLRDYLARVFSKLSTENGRYVTTAATAAPPLAREARPGGSSIDHAYVPLDLRTPRRMGDGIADQTRRSRMRRVRDPKRFVCEADSAVVVKGEPGAGKSTLLRYIALGLTQAAMDKSCVSAIPIFLPLSEYEGRTPFGDPCSVASFFEHQIRSLLGDPTDSRPIRRTLQALRRSGRLVIFLDAVDELPPADYQARMKQVIAFGKTIMNQGGRVVLSCRERQYVPWDLPCREIVISPLDERRISAFIARYLAGAGASRKLEILSWVLDRDRDLFQLCQNPFFLQLFIEYVSSLEPGDDFESRLSGARLSNFFATFVSRLFQRARESCGFSNALEPFFSRSLGIVAKRRLRRELARPDDVLAEIRALQEEPSIAAGRRPGRRTAQLDDVLLKTQHLQIEQLRAMLEAACDLGILKGKPEAGRYGFRHRRLQEYLAANELALIGVSPHEFLALPPTADSLSEILPLYVQMVEHPETLLEEILTAADQHARSASANDEQARIDALVLAARCISTPETTHASIVARTREGLLETLRSRASIDRVDSLVALRHVMPAKSYGYAIAAISDPSPWVHETAISMIQVASLPIVSYLNVVARSLYHVGSVRLLARLVWKNLGLLSSGRALTLATFAATLLVTRIATGMLVLCGSAALPLIALWSVTRTGGVSESVSNATLGVLGAAAILVYILMWLAISTWSALDLKRTSLLASVVATFAAIGLALIVPSTGKSSTPGGDGATFGMRGPPTLPELYVCAAVLLVTAMVVLIDLAGRRRVGVKKLIPVREENERGVRDVLGRYWFFLAPPILAVSFTIGFAAPMRQEQDLGQAALHPRFLRERLERGIFAMLTSLFAIAVTIAIRAVQQHRAYRRLVTSVHARGTGDAYGELLEYLTGPGPNRLKAGAARAIAEAPNPTDAFLARVRATQNADWGPEPLKDLLWQSLRMLRQQKSMIEVSRLK